MNTDRHAYRAESASDYRRKIIALPALLAAVDEARRAGRTIVQCHGCFDIVHPGHLRYLHFARRQGDLLIVSITGDVGVDKGEMRPYIPQELRAENLAALQFVDFVVVDSNPTACDLLSSIRPDVYVKGQEYATSNHAGFLAERAAVEAHGGRVVFSSGDVVFSSSRLIESLRPIAALERRRLESICLRHGINSETLGDFVDVMARKKVLIVGDVVLDRYLLCEADSFAGEAAMLSLRTLDRQDYLGAAGAVALQAAALGASPVLVTTAGNDDRSNRLLDRLTAAGVELFVLRTRRSVVVRTRYLVDEQKVFRVDDVENSPLDSVGERQAADAILDRARLADVAILADSGFGTFTPGLLQRLGGSFHQRCPLLVGGISDDRGDLLALRHLALCVGSERRLRAALRDKSAGLSSLAYQFLSISQSQRLLLTLGKRGTVAFDRPTLDPTSPAWSGRLKSEHLPALTDFARDRLGCSETVLVTAALALAGGASLMQGVYLAAAAAAIQVARLGRSPIDSDTLRTWLDGRPELAPDASHDEPILLPAPAAHSV